MLLARSSRNDDTPCEKGPADNIVPHTSAEHAHANGDVKQLEFGENTKDGEDGNGTGDAGEDHEASEGLPRNDVVGVDELGNSGPNG